ncbi:MAG: MOSC domain-containing protein [Chloroflexi bacterium]|nr:MOSC domain-containing protein [Chloroflexota bacterium]
MARILAVCRSNKKGISKQPIGEGLFRENYGLVDDAHADSGTHRQVSLLALASIEKMQSLGIELDCGGLAENLTVAGLELISLPIGTRLAIEQGVILEVTQIGKECHTACAIRRQVGYCIMPTEGIFARVIKGGLVKTGDEIKVIKDEA